MAQEKITTNLPQRFSFEEYSKSLLREDPQKGKEDQDYVSEAAYLIFVELLKQIHLTPNEIVKEIKDGGKALKNGHYKYPFEILLEDIQPEKSTEEIRKGLEFLIKKNRRYHLTKNSKNETIEFCDGIISNPHIGSDGILVSVSALRIQKLLEIPLEDVAAL